MITISHRGDFRRTEKFMTAVPKKNYRAILEKYGAQGVTALSGATPVDTGETANSWTYKVEIKGTGLSITWFNSVIAGTAPVAILIQYGHATNGGGYVQGRDFINPAMRSIFDQLADNLWKEVTSL